MNKADLLLDSYEPEEEDHDPSLPVGSGSLTFAWQEPLPGYSTKLVGLGNCAVPWLENEPRRRVNTREWIFPVPYLPWSEASRDRLWSTILAEKWLQDPSPEAALYSPLARLNDIEASVLHSFLVDLYLYDSITGGRFRDSAMGWHSLLVSSVRQGPAFAEYWEGVRFHVLAELGRKHFLEPPDKPGREVALSLADKIRSIGELYRTNNLMRWEPVHDSVLPIVNTPIEADESVYEEFRAAVRSFLGDERFAVLKELPLSFALKDSATKCKEGYTWEVPCTAAASVRGTSTLCYINRELKGARSAVIEEASSVNRIRWIEYNVQQILQQDRRSVTRYDLSTVLKLMQRHIGVRGRYYRGKQNFFYCRDFEKEGLTKPRRVLRVLLEELFARFKWDCFAATSFFDEWRLLIDGVEYHPTRGHGLGMANALTTLMQLVIEDMLVARTGLRPKWSGYLNDDACVIFPGGVDDQAWIRADQEVCAGLGLRLKPQKTFTSTCYGVLCEQHVMVGVKEFSDKKVCQFQELGVLLKAINVAHARHLSNSVNAHGQEAWGLSIVTQYWGWMLYRNEWNYPIAMGGWFRKEWEGIDCTFADTDPDMELTQQQNAAWYALQHTRLRRRFWGKRKEVPSKMTLLGYPAEFQQIMGQDPINCTENRFAPSRGPKTERIAWRNYLADVRKKFSDAARNAHIYPVTWREVYLKEVDAHPERDYYPPLGEGYKVPLTDEAVYDRDVSFCNPYISHGIGWMYQQFVRGTAPYTLQMHQHLQRKLMLHGRGDRTTFGAVVNLRNMQRREGRRMIQTKVWNIAYMPPEPMMRSFHNPFGMCTISDRVERRYCGIIPRYIPAAKLRLLELRDAWFGRPLTALEWMQIGSLSPDDIIVVWAMRERCLDPLAYELEDLVSQLHRAPGLGRIISSWSPDDLEKLCPRLVPFYVQWYKHVYEPRVKRGLGPADPSVRLYDPSADDSYEGQVPAEDVTPELLAACSSELWESLPEEATAIPALQEMPDETELALGLTTDLSEWHEPGDLLPEADRPSEPTDSRGDPASWDPGPSDEDADYSLTLDSIDEVIIDDVEEDIYLSVEQVPEEGNMFPTSESEPGPHEGKVPAGLGLSDDYLEF